MEQHYLDNSATTPVLQEAAEKAAWLMTQAYGNPSSLHTMGFQAKCVLDDAREILAKALGAQPKEVYFTSGGTESNNLAVLGAAAARKRLGNRIVTTAIEHPAVLSAMHHLETAGYEVVYIKPEQNGNLTEESIATAIDEKTILVSLMLVNNETGAVLPVKAAADAIKRKKAPALLHTDAVQAFLKIPVLPKKLGADLVTVSAHKVHGPKGVGALYLSEKARITQRLFGGGQEKNLRPGTEALPLIGAFAEAVALAGNSNAHYEQVKQLNMYLRAKLSGIKDIQILSPDDALPYVLNFSAGKIRAETMLHFLSAKGIFVSSGSACGRAKPSHVLGAMGLPRAVLESSLRVSFSRFSTEADVDAITGALQEGMKNLAHA